LGRSFFLATDETWRWRYRTGERDHDRFWLQLVRYASEEPYAADDGRLALDLDPVTIDPGEVTHVRARILDDNGAPATSPPPSISVVGKNGSPVRTIALEPSTGMAGR